MYILDPILILKYKLDVFLVFDKLLDLCEIKVTKSLILSSRIDPKIFLLQISFAKKNYNSADTTFRQAKLFSFFKPDQHTQTDPDRTTHQYCSQN